MGKFILASVLALALVPATIAGAALPPALQKIESGYYAQLQRLYRDYGTSCSSDLNERDRAAFELRIDQLNSRRMVDYRRYNAFPSNYPYCTYGYGGPA